MHGCPLDLMPTFDRVAREHTHIANSFTCAPVCGPTRACLQTGTYINRNGTVHNGKGLSKGLPTLASCFKDAGYRTGYIGKWHLGGAEDAPDHVNQYGAVARHARGGYEDWLGVEALEMSSADYRTTLYDTDDKPMELPGFRVDALTDAGIRYIDSHKDEPFFLMMSFIEPHHQNDRDSYPAPTGYRERYTGRWTPPDLAALPGVRPRLSHADINDLQIGGSAPQQLGGYYGMVKRLDEAFGRVLDALKSLGLDDDTVVLFTSDHGCHFKTRNKEYKRSCHDSSIRVPTCLVGGPFKGGGHVHEMVSLVDLPPTLLDAAGIEVPTEMQGQSLLPLTIGEREGWPSEVFVQVCDGPVGRAVRTARWKYCVMSDREARDVGGDFASVTYQEAFLYDLEHDPYELTNLIDFDSHTSVRERMRSRLKTRMFEAGEAEPKIEVIEETVPSGQRQAFDYEVDA